MMAVVRRELSRVVTWLTSLGDRGSQRRSRSVSRGEDNRGGRVQEREGRAGDRSCGMCLRWQELLAAVGRGKGQRNQQARESREPREGRGLV